MRSLGSGGLRRAKTAPKLFGGGLLACIAFACVTATSTFAQTPTSHALQLPLSAQQPGGTSVEQTSAPLPGSTVDTIHSQVQVQGVYTGSVPETGVLPAALRLTLYDAIERGLRTNLGIIGSGTASLQARAQMLQARSALLPDITASLSEDAAKINLTAEGLSAQSFGLPSGPFSIPSTAGPFHYYDLHGALQQDVLDLTATQNLRSARQSALATALNGRQAREEVLLGVASVYLQTLAMLTELQEQQAEVRYGEASYKQAQAQVDAGNKAPIEANRSLVELHTEQQRLSSLGADITKQKYRLERMIGLPLTIDLQLADTLSPMPVTTPPVDLLVQSAYTQRQDLKAGEAQLRAAIEARKAARAEALPSASIAGQYGLQATDPTHGLAVFQASASISIPLFQGGRVRADTINADAVVAQRQAELQNKRGTVEAEVRDAYVDLKVASEQVATAASNHELAQQDLQQSLDRSSVGVADSTEVLSSQHSLAAANLDYVNSLFSQYIARLNLAHATGETENVLIHLFQGAAR